MALITLPCATALACDTNVRVASCLGHTDDMVLCHKLCDAVSHLCNFKAGLCVLEGW
jgi:hypothetical protein